MTHSAPAASAPTASADLDSARTLLRTEADALEALAGALDGSFVAALDRLSGISGRVVVSGMGKSGHIAHKIAATLASTGTPALYVHPGEASHGDLGMITREDAVIALSNSGETPELGDIVAYTRRFALPLVAITSRAGSALATAADVSLVLPPAPEACPLGLAPTTSTTMMLALGDAIAVALYERRGFSAEDFRGFHPGGQLGRRLLKVADLMHAGSAVPLTPGDTPMAEALLVMTTKSFGCIGIVERDRLVGIITDGDLRRNMSVGLLANTAASVMNAAPKTVRPNQLAAEALQIMNAKNITSLFVVDEEGRPAGILHIHDCLRAGLA